VKQSALIANVGRHPQELPYPQYNETEDSFGRKKESTQEKALLSKDFMFQRRNRGWKKTRQGEEKMPSTKGECCAAYSGKERRIA